MTCIECGKRIESYQSRESCCRCGWDLHSTCGHTKRVATTRFYEWLTGKSYVEYRYCESCYNKPLN